jgi:hypothetical protein
MIFSDGRHLDDLSVDPFDVTAVIEPFEKRAVSHPLARGSGASRLERR